MTNPRYRPRDFCVEPQVFGKTAVIEWKPAATRNDAILLAAAYAQHVYSVRIRQRLGKRSLRVYATESGVSYDRMMKMLRGEIVMRLEDIAVADLLLGDVSDFTSDPTEVPDTDLGAWGRLAYHAYERLLARSRKEALSSAP